MFFTLRFIYFCVDIVLSVMILCYCWLVRGFDFGGLIGTACAVLAIILGVYFFYYSFYYYISRIETVLRVQKETKLQLGIDEDKNGRTSQEFERKTYLIFDQMIQELMYLVKREYSSELLKNQAELNAMQSQINPHFLYNTLESIRGLAIKYNVLDIAIMTKAMADMFRFIISKKGNFIDFRDEMANIDNYMKIQQFRFDNKFKIEKYIDEDTLDNQIPKLLIQPIVENALKYGLEMKRGKGKLIITAHNTQNKFIVNIKDDGLGMPLQKLKQLNEILGDNKPSMHNEREIGSIGLSNVNERIKMTFGNEYGIIIFSAENVGTNVEITLKPIKKKPEKMQTEFDDLIFPNTN